MSVSGRTVADVPRLIAPTPLMHASWLESRDEWGRGVHQDGAGLHAEDDVESAEGFSAWIDRLRSESDPSVPVEPGRVRATYWWIIEDETHVGAITLRHHLNDFLLNAGGHIGYAIRPAFRRRGLASWALGAVLPEAKTIGLNAVLITCDAGNLASAKVIERHGGQLEDIRDTDLGRTKRYWITL